MFWGQNGWSKAGLTAILLQMAQQRDKPGENATTPLHIPTRIPVFPIELSALKVSLT